MPVASTAGAAPRMAAKAAALRFVVDFEADLAHVAARLREAHAAYAAVRASGRTDGKAPTRPPGPRAVSRAVRVRSGRVSRPRSSRGRGSGSRVGPVFL